MTTVAVSGGFDPLHRGHVRLIEAAARHGDQVIVLLHSDRWLTRKKGYCVMSYRERREILLALRHVDQVIRALDQPDGGCDRTLRRVTPDVFCNGGDRRQTPPAEQRAVESYGGRVLHGVGGTRKVQSSSWLVEAAARRQRATRPSRDAGATGDKENAARDAAVPAAQLS